MSLPEQPSSPTEDEIRQHRRQSEEAADVLETALRVARMPVPQGLSPAYGLIGQGYGPRLVLGTLGLYQAQQWIEALHRHARAHGYVMDAEACGLASQVLAEFRVPTLSGDGTHSVREELGQ
ncbi:hypothetical protein ACFRAR_02840 [Kitasatospora sp. NPDC056651]|uniref:hypothetical protein n=1 Tax=Kitasatospora sp. NPDC056651 TaxID=3345892 RepID=UPI003681ACE1